MNDSFYTGNQIEINPNLVSDQIILLLDEFHDKISRGETPEINPMKERIIMQTDEGKAFEIPEDIQRMAIEKWLAIKNSREMGGIKYNIKKYKINKNRIIDEENDDSDNEELSITNWIKYILFFIILALLFYFVVYKSKYLSNLTFT
jgi:hypothetical protein